MRAILLGRERSIRYPAIRRAGRGLLICLLTWFVFYSSACRLSAGPGCAEARVPKAVHLRSTLTVACNSPGRYAKPYDNARNGLTTTLSPILFALFLHRSGFGVYSIDRHVSIEKYNILWFK